MTYMFHIGDPAPVQSRDPATVPVGHDWAEVGPGGVQLLIKRSAPSEADNQAVEYGPVALGLRDAGRPGFLLVEIGEPGRPGHIEAEVEVDPRTGWWGLDFELALCDRGGIVRAVRRFEGPDAEATALWAVENGTGMLGAVSGALPYVAVFPDDRYGLMQPRGAVTVDTVVEAGLALVELPGWQPGFTEVWDFRFAGELYFSPLELGRLRSLEMLTKDQLAGSRTLVVTANRQLVEWSARNYARLARVLLGRVVLPYGTAEDAARDLGVGVLPTLDVP